MDSLTAIGVSRDIDAAERVIYHLLATRPDLATERGVRATLAAARAASAALRRVEHVLQAEADRQAGTTGPQ